MISANVNYYAINPFNNPLAVNDPDKKSFSAAGNEPRPKPLLDEGTTAARRLQAGKDAEIELPSLDDFEASDLEKLKGNIPGMEGYDIPDLSGFEVPKNVEDIDLNGVEIGGVDMGTLNWDALKELTPEEIAAIDRETLEAMGFNMDELPIPDVDNIHIPERDAFTKIVVPDN